MLNLLKGVLVMKKLINIQLTEEFIKEIKEFAKNNDMTVTTLIKLALKEYITNHQ